MILPARCFPASNLAVRARDDRAGDRLNARMLKRIGAEIERSGDNIEFVIRNVDVLTHFFEEIFARHSLFTTEGLKMTSNVLDVRFDERFLLREIAGQVIHDEAKHAMILE